MTLSFVAKCPECAAVVHSPIGIDEGSKRITLQGISSQCPKCGRMVEFPDVFIEDAGRHESISVRSAPGETRAWAVMYDDLTKELVSVQSLEHLRRILENPKQSWAKPIAEEAIRRLGSKNVKKVLAFILAVWGGFQAAQKKPKAESDHEQISVQVPLNVQQVVEGAGGNGTRIGAPVIIHGPINVFQSGGQLQMGSGMQSSDVPGERGRPREFKRRKRKDR